MPDKYFNKSAKGLITSILVLLVPTAICYYSLLTLHTSSKLVVRTQNVISLLEQLESTMKDAETGVRGYLITGEKSFLEPYSNASVRVDMNYSQLKTLMHGDETQQKALILLDEQIKSNFSVLDSIYTAINREEQISVLPIKQGKARMDSLRATVRQIRNWEYGQLQARVSAENDNMIYTTVLILTIILIEIGLVYWFYKKLSTSFMRVFALKKTLKQSHLIMNQRVEAIQKVAYRISQGKYDIKLNESEEDHLGILAASINKMSASLKQSFDATNELMKHKDDFIGIASHELKTPLTSIKAIIQIISKMTFNGETNNLIHPLVFRANSQVKRLAQIVENLLDVSKLNEEKIELQPSIFKISEAIKECANEVLPAANSHNLVMEGDLDTSIYADKFRIDQVLVNLLSNAVKYSPNAAKVIATISSGSEYIKVSITDFGIGIPDDKQPYIFDRYYRVHKSSQSFSGLGLGLFISSEIIKRHKGSIGIESGVDQGSSFWFTLPINGSGMLS